VVRLRQVVLVAHDLDAIVEELCGALGVQVCYRDPGVVAFGLRNALMPVGDSFIEVVSPMRDDTAAGRYLERRGGDGGYMVMVQVDNLARERERVRGLGVRTVWEGTGPGITGMHLHPADVGGAILSMDEAEPPASWGWAGPDWGEHVGSEVAIEIAAVELQSGENRSLAERWAEVLGRPIEHGSAGDEAVIKLDSGAVRVVGGADGRGEGLGGFDLVACERRRAGEMMLLGGVRIRLI
jgi:Glyoxalase-like domain